MKRLTLYSLLNFLMMLPTLASGQGTPSITAFSPASGPHGTIVTITGVNFGSSPGDNTVYFGAAKASISSATQTQLEVIVPPGATHQPVTVTVNGLTACSAYPFIVTFPFSGTIGGSFTNRSDLWAGYQTKWSAVTDLDGDGKTDIVVVDQGSNVVSIFRNISSPGSLSWDSFESKLDFETGQGPYAVAWGDLDGDGKPDLLVTNANESSISILRNISTPGAIAFSARVDLPALFGPLSAAIKDLDLDGKPDIAITNSNTLSIFKNTSLSGSLTPESFETRVDFPAGRDGIWSVVLQDLDGDDRPDITVASGGDDLVSIFRNITAPGSITSSSFETKVDLLTGDYPSIVSVADMDGDRKPDLMVGNCGGNTVSIFRNIGSTGTLNSASFDSRIDLVSNGCPWNPTAGDVDGDGRLDIVVRNSWNGTLSILRNNASVGVISPESFSPPYVVNTEGNSLGISVADMDGDGLSDLTLSNEGTNVITVFRNSNTFDPAGPSNLTFSNITTSTLTANFLGSPDSPDGYIVIRRIGSPPDPPEDGLVYSQGQQFGDNVVAFNGKSTTFDDAGLTSGVEYYYHAYAYYHNGITIDYVTHNPATNIAFITGFDLGPIITVTPAVFTLDDEITITFDATKSYPVNALVGASYVYMYSGVISEGPESGNWNLNHTTYGLMDYVGDDTWSITFVPRYFYNHVPLDLTVHRLAMVFFDDESHKGVSYDGRDIYLPVSPTLIEPPQALPATFVSSTGFEAEWIGIDGISQYQLDVSASETFESFVHGYEGKIIQGWSAGTLRTTVGGLLPDKNYYYRVRVAGKPENSSTISVTTHSHPPTASPNVWVKTHGGPTTDDEIQSMTSDDHGNLYAAGHFTGTITIGTTTLTSKGEYDIFYVRYDPEGNVVWARSIGGYGRDNEVSLATDSKGLYMAAQFSSGIDVDPGEGSKHFWNSGQPWINDGFFARYNLNDGSLVWARQLPDASTWSSSSIGVDHTGVYLAGHFYGTVDFDPGESVALLTAQDEDVFLAKYSLKGDYMWASAMGGYFYDTAWGLLLSSTGVYIHGHYSWGNDFDPAQGYYSLEGEGGFFGRYDRATGNLVYVKNVGNGTIYSLAKFGNELFISGDSYGIIDADPDNGFQHIGEERYNHGIVGKYSLLDGSYHWARSLVSTGFIGPRKVIADGTGLYVSGYFAGSVDFNPGRAQSNRTSVRIDAFASRFSRKDGSLEWAKGIGSPGFAVSIAATLSKQGYYLAGLYANTVNFDPYNGDVFQTSSGGSADIFIARYQPSKKVESDLDNGDNDGSGESTAEQTVAIRLFPNPVDKILGIEWKGFYSNEPISISVLDVYGGVLFTREVNTDENSLDVSELPKGYYIFQARQQLVEKIERFVKR